MTTFSMRQALSASCFATPCFAALPILGLVLTIVAWTVSPSPASAAGYWSCAGATWVAVGHPEHPKPIKQCGAKWEFPRTQAACEQVGGRWGRAGLSLRPICTVPTRDAGRICADTGECEGTCVATLSRAQRAHLIRRQRTRQKLRMLGKCTPHRPTFGCMAIVHQGFVTGILCRD